ncbi:beta-class carbonic anhydrase [Fictibacillus phosphorivorans]|uniref:beta-class carbonic anhydrase n=1 Tax=Fictibacillus phosphorivorans TaxID=1221500 RepID=UPI00203A6656|nr:carbonic anhydrase [Fictibacillus phosphorivorans]MCM3720262.1 carbonic anhydrase [Fictibacillus phosphorivorans]MCM3777942.1 carbonic anhydrase [Fictibacillus phosphorivorans]
MSILNEILTHNQNFVENKQYEPFQTTKFPDKGLVIVSCMDTRLTELMPSAMNIKNGDVKIIKSAGAVISHPFGSVMRSILVAIYALKAKEVMVIGHHDCGMSNVNADELIGQMQERGIEQSTLDTIKYSGLDLKKWVHGFESVEDSVQNSVELVRNHPLLPEGIKVHGLVIDPETGRLDVVDADIE